MTVAVIRPVKPRQSLGQNFLVDDNIGRNIVRSLTLQPDDVVFEIGPGRGALTKLLAGKVRHLIGVEIDGRVVDDLRKAFSSDSVTILHQDILETSLQEFSNRFGTRIRIVGNIPYHLTSPILFRIFDEFRSVRDCTLMVQKEVARRIAAKPGTKSYGILSVMTQFYGKSEILFDVSPNCFYPKPSIVSSVFRFTALDELPWKTDESLFKAVVKTTFGKRRKTLRSSLAYLPYRKAMISKTLTSIDFPLDKRPEQLSIEQFVNLTNQLGRYLV